MFSSSGSQPVTVQNTGHVTPDGKVQVPVSVRPVGPENAVRPSKVSSRGLSVSPEVPRSSRSHVEVKWSRPAALNQSSRQQDGHDYSQSVTAEDMWGIKNNPENKNRNKN